MPRHIAMKFSIHLFREEVTTFDDLIKKESLSGVNAYQELLPASSLPYPCKAFVQTARFKSPKWLDFLGDHFETSGMRIQTASSAFVLLLKAGGRIFAVTFGYGFLALDRSKIEPRFGLMGAFNIINPARIRTIDTRNLEQVVKQRRTHVSIESTVSEFGFDPQIDLVRYVSGKPKDKDVATNVSGADSMHITCEISLPQLGKKCEELLKQYKSDTYKEHFGFADSYDAVKSSDPLLPKLESELVDQLKKRLRGHIVAAFPDFFDETRVEQFQISVGHKNIRVPDLHIGTVYQLYDAHPEILPDPHKAWVVGLDADGNPATEKLSLRECLVCEVTEENDTFTLTFGQWFRAGRSFVEKIKKQVSAIEDLTNRLQMPSMREGEKEGDYNKRTAEHNNWLLLDKKLVQIEGHDRIEICDLATNEGHFIAVKRMRDSATLSHLFAQGSVSATLLRGDDAYRGKVASYLDKKWSGHFIETPTRKACFVFALPMRGAGSVGAEMFLFSKIHLLSHVKLIQGLGFQVALCKIQYGDVAKAGVH